MEPSRDPESKQIQETGGLGTPHRGVCEHLLVPPIPPMAVTGISRGTVCKRGLGEIRYNYLFLHLHAPLMNETVNI